MKTKNEKKKWMMGLGMFLSAMLIMTFVSRIIYVGNMPQVRWTHPSASSIRNSLSVEGTVEAVNSSAITGMNGLLVEKVNVTRGEQIGTDTVLYEVDMEDLQSQLGILQVEEEVWQAQVKAEKSTAAMEIARAQEDYNTAVAEMDRKIAKQAALLENAKEDMELHMFRIPKEDAADEVWIAWADERTRIQREIDERERALEEAGIEKETFLTQAGRTVEDAKSEQNKVEGSYSSSYNTIGQVQERQQKIEEWTELSEAEGKVYAGQEGTILEVMLESGMRMGEGAVMRYADAESSFVFRTVISQEEKSMVHTGDSVRISFPGSSEEITETIDSIVQENGSYSVTVWLDADVAQGKTEGIMELNVTSEIYDFVIPGKALHNDGDTNYIYIMEENAGILGTQLTVRRLVVRLLDQNEDRAAIAEDILQSDMMIITDSDKALENGIAVREWDTMTAQ